MAIRILTGEIGSRKLCENEGAAKAARKEVLADEKTHWTSADGRLTIFGSSSALESEEWAVLGESGA